MPFSAGSYPASAVVDGRLQLVTYDDDNPAHPQYLLVGGHKGERPWVPSGPPADLAAAAGLLHAPLG